MGIALVIVLMLLNVALGYALAVFLGHDSAAEAAVHAAPAEPRREELDTPRAPARNSLEPMIQPDAPPTAVTEEPTVEAAAADGFKELAAAAAASS